MRAVKPGAAIIAAACFYEALAITTSRTPTITALTRARHPRVRAVAVLSFSGWLWRHMMRPDP